MYANILLIENDENCIFLIDEALRQFSSFTFDLQTVHSYTECCHTDFSEYDIVLSSILSPDDRIIEFIKLFHGKTTDIPFLLLTNEERPDLLVDIMKMGIKDFISKDQNIFGILPYRLKMCIEDRRLKKIASERLSDQESTRIRFETINQILTTISHYINNSSTTISGYAQLCQLAQSDEYHHNKLIELSLRESEKISVVIQELERSVKMKKELSTVCYADVENQLFDMNDVIQERIKKLNEATKIR